MEVVASRRSTGEAERSDLRERAAKARSRAEELDAVFDPVAVAERRSREEAAARAQAERLEIEGNAKALPEAEAEAKKKQEAAEEGELARLKVSQQIANIRKGAEAAEKLAAKASIGEDRKEMEELARKLRGNADAMEDISDPAAAIRRKHEQEERERERWEKAQSRDSGMER